MYRYEKKYIINTLQVEILKQRLFPIMKLDNNLGESTFYSIRSIYFDDYYDTNLKQVINGVSERFKYRIRFYNYSDKYIMLEKKIKINNMSKKISCSLTKKQVYNILNNINLNVSKENNKLLNEFYLMIKTRYYRPKVIIDYDRIPFVYEAGNVRVTIDYNLSCCSDFNRIFSKRKSNIPLMEDGYCILEVKYNDFIPDFIRYALQLNELERISYSKYGKGRLMIKNVLGGSI